MSQKRFLFGATALTRPNICMIEGEGGDGGEGGTATEALGGGGGAQPQGGAQPPQGSGQGFDALANYNDEAFFSAFLQNADPELKNDPSINRHKTISGAMKSLQHATGQVGRDKLPMPKGPDDSEALNQIYKAIGRPEKPDEYVFPKPKGRDFTDADKAFHAAIAPVLHAAGTSQAGLEQIGQAFTEYMEKQAGAAGEASETKLKQEWATLETEWGDAFDQKVQGNRAYVKSLGFTEAELAEGEKFFGTAGLMKFLDKAKSATTPTGFMSGEGDGGGDFALTPAQAQSALAKVRKELAPFAERSAKGESIGKDPEYKTLKAREAQLMNMIHGTKPIQG